MTDLSPLPDRELDARVARALGWTDMTFAKFFEGAKGIQWGRPPGASPLTGPILVPAYSTDWRAMGDLLAALRERGWGVGILEDIAPGEWEVTLFNEDRKSRASAPTLPRAVAEAAVLALEGE